MVYTKLTKNAIKRAYKAHLNEVDDEGLPTVFKVFVRAGKMESEHEACAALLYMAVKNKKLSLDSLKGDYPFQVTDAIFILIPDDSLSYPDYIRRIKTNDISTKIKVVELEEKIASLSLNKNKNKVKSDLERYNFALNILKK